MPGVTGVDTLVDTTTYCDERLNPQSVTTGLLLDLGAQ